MRGRDSLQDVVMWRWADEGVGYLYKHFSDKLEFSTSVDIDKREVLLTVHRKVPGKSYAVGEQVFQVVEPVQYFVSQLTVTKLILIAG